MKSRFLVSAMAFSIAGTQVCRRDLEPVLWVNAVRGS
jgi:hypothetical protein